MKLDGQDIYFPAGRNEAVRCLTAGLHTLDIDGIRDGNVVVRSIAEIFSYSAMKDSKIAGNGSYQWDFVEKYVAYALTTFNGGQLDPDKSVADEIQKLGFKWLTDAYIPDYLPGAGKAVKFDTIRGLNDPRFAGVTCNEFGFDDEIKLGLYSQMLHETRNVNNRLIYTWIGKKPEMWLHCDFMSNSLNASRGKGKLIYEAYCYSQSSEKEAQVYLDDYMVDTIKRFNLLYPNANSNTGMVLGLLTQIPIESRDWYPSVDYKYYLDMQMNMLANRKEFKNLSLIGVYGTHYADEELYRWAFKLMRHYAIDGKKTMLSSEYGFKYNPGFLKNCDFTDGITGWDKTGTITTDSIPDYGKNIQNRRDSPKGTGDTFAKFKRGKSPNTLAQVASGLTAGKFYCLQFAVADYKDAQANIINPRLLGLNVELPGTEIVKDKSFIFVDKRPNENNDSTDNQDDARINLHRIVFRSTASSQAVIFSDEQAKPGEELILNYVKLTPYFE